MKRYSRVLAIAGSDSGGGAGIQADIKTISATGCYAASAVTAVTVQNTLGVRAVHNVPVDIVRGQITAVLDDIGADAVKIGMLSSAELVMTVTEALAGYDIRNIVLDPVMVATSGDRLLDEDAVSVLLKRLAPMARVFTPNIPEAETIIGRKVVSSSELPGIARELSDIISADAGRKVSVLMKGGHLEDDCMTDFFYNAEDDRMVPLRSGRIVTKNTHGTGCTLSSAVASYLALGMTLEDAVAAAKGYITSALVSGADYETGHGHGPVDHFFKLR